MVTMRVVRPAREQISHAMVADHRRNGLRSTLEVGPGARDTSIWQTKKADILFRHSQNFCGRTELGRTQRLQSFGWIGGRAGMGPCSIGYGHAQRCPSTL